MFGDDYNSIRRQALIIKSWGTNVYVKIPVVNSKGAFMGKIIKELNNKNIKLNITAVYNANQTKKNLKMFKQKIKSNNFNFCWKGSRHRKRSNTRI